MCISPLKLLSQGSQWWSVLVLSLGWALRGDFAVVWSSQSRDGSSWSALSELLGGKSPTTACSSMSSALQCYPQLSLSSFVLVASEGWCSLASGEWVSSPLSVTLDSQGHQKAGTLSWGMAGSFSVPLFNHTADRGKTTDTLLYLQVSRVKILMGLLGGISFGWEMLIW